MSDRTERIGMNEALFREVNERIEQLQEDTAGLDTFNIVCECGALDCTERFLITSDEYQTLRQNPRRFAVVPGHERPEVERAVERRDAYTIVEKTDPDAAQAVEEAAK
jgi:hypothetical protein